MTTSIGQRSKISLYQDRCRVCLEKTNKLYPLVGEVANVETTISHMITCCTSLEVEIRDDLPKGVCIPCFRIIRIAYNFINQYKETLKILNENQITVENLEIETETGIDHTEELKDTVKQEESDNIKKNIFNKDTKEQEKNMSVLYKVEENDETYLEEEEEEDEYEVEACDYEIQVEDDNEEQEVVKNEDDCSDCDFEQLSEESNTEYALEDSYLENIKQSDPVEDIVIITKRNQSEDLQIPEIQVPDVTKPKYTLRTKIVSQLKCPKCFNKFTGYDKKYKDHIVQLHGKETFNCNLCSKCNLNVKEYLNHFDEVHRYQCPICYKSFLKNSMRALHMKEHSNVICKQSNLNSVNIKNELENDHVVNVTEEQDNANEILNECSEERTNNIRRRLVTRYKCPKCPSSGPFLNYERGFVHHIVNQHSHELFNCNLCTKMDLDTDDFLKHFEDVHRHQCPICMKSFNRISTKHVHMKRHSNIRYNCGYCDKSFYAPWFLKKHMNKHTQTIKYTCEECGYVSSTYDNFRYHMKKHRGPRHLCTYCGQSFLLAVHLKYHMWKHTGDKYFKCDQCTKSYTSSSQLKKHKRRHH